MANRVDFILIHVHPYWEAIDVGNASSFVVEKWEDIQAKYPNKPVIIGETGWPSGGEPNGEAIPSQDNQKKFMRDFLNLAYYYNIPYFYFEAFDERWKIRSESSAGANWGIYYSNGTLKQALKKGSSLIKALDEFNRSPRIIQANIPWSIYVDDDLSDNRFYPTGWMGELEKWQGDPKDILNLSCTESPFSEKYCIKITYKPHINEWGGIYWQYPSNNWGESPGYNLSIAKRLTFWTRGEKGGEKAEFEAGGIEDSGKPFRDSFGPISTGIIELKKNWEKHSIDLSGQDLSMVIGGFCWTTNWEQNPDGATIYIDDIKYE